MSTPAVLQAERLPAAPAADSISITREQIRAYLESLSARGRRQDTIKVYAPKLESFFDALPEGKRVTRDTLAGWRSTLLESGYSPGTANTYISAVNGLLGYLGRRDLQLTGQLTVEDADQPELNRTEYLRLLSTARALGKERVYLLIKLFASTGLAAQETRYVTAEAVQAGVIPLPRGPVRMPACLRAELLDYLRRQGLRAGPVFVTRSGKPLSRTAVSDCIRHLCRDARVPEGRGNPRCLRKLYFATQAEIDAQVRQLAEAAYDRLLEAEQLAIGWEDAGASSGL